MKVKLADVNADAEQLLPPNQPDGSGVGVNYADAFIKPLNTILPDGTIVTCKRKGLRLTFGIGDRTGQALLSRHNDGPDPRTIFHRALSRAVEDAGARLLIELGTIHVER